LDDYLSIMISPLLPINKVERLPDGSYALTVSEWPDMMDRKDRYSTAEADMKYHDDVASEEIIRATERHFKKIIDALKKA